MASAVIRVPPLDELSNWMAAVLDVHGPTAVLRAVLQSVDGQRVMAITEELCTRQFGGEPVMVDATGQASVALTCRASAAFSHCARLSCSGDRLGRHTEITFDKPCQRARHEEASAYRGQR